MRATILFPLTRRRLFGSHGLRPVKPSNRSLPRDRNVSLLQRWVTLVVIITVTHASSVLLEKEIYEGISESTNLQNESTTQAPLWS